MQPKRVRSKGSPGDTGEAHQSLSLSLSFNLGKI